MMNFKQLLLHVNARPFIDQARFGIEREGQRVDLAGNLAKTDHPAIFGDRSYHPYIQTDFSETQTEMIPCYRFYSRIISVSRCCL